MKITYNKLIRDHIPEIINRNGKKYSVRKLSQDEFSRALAAKLIEEGKEVAEAISGNDRIEIIKELADLSEVFETLIDVLDIKIDEIREIQLQRKNTRGGFSERLWLDWVEE